MATVYIDESSGSDVTGKGTLEQPYQSLAFALFTSAPSPPLKLLIRKDPSASYDEPTQSALKKARKGADGLEKKRKKQEESAERDLAEKREERERKEKLLEQSKQIVLVEDTKLPKPTRVRLFFSPFHSPVATC